MQKKLKKIFLTCLILTFISLFASCSNSPDQPEAQETNISGDTTTDEDIETDDDTETIKDERVGEDDSSSDTEKKLPIEDTPNIIPLFLVKTIDSLYFADHEKMELWKTGKIDKAGPRVFSIDNELIELDASGDVIDTTTLDHTPTRIKSTPTGNYYCVEIPPDEAYALGALYRTYTETFKNGVQIGPEWYLNEFECKDIVSAGENVFLIDEFGSYHVIDGIAENVAHVHDNQFYIHDIDYIDNTIGFNDSIYSFGANFVTMSRQWINFDGLNYSEHGDTWNTADGLSESVTAMSDFNISPFPVVPELPNGEAPTLLAVGSAGTLLYWIECNSGFLFEYDSISNELTQKWALYNSNNTREVGVIKRDTLKPLIVGEKLYFSNQSAIYSIDLGDGIINIFYGGNGEVLAYD